MTRIRVPLGKFIKEYSERNKGNEDIPVYSVTNSQGFCTEYFGKEVASQDKTTYKIVPQGYFAYNPSRINVGSVDWQRYEKRVIVSPLYNVFSVSEGIDRQYLYYFLRSDLGRQMIKAKASGSVRDNLKLDMLKEMTIPDISVEQQKFCSSVLDKLHKLIQMRQQELQKLDEFIKARFVEMFGDVIHNSKKWQVCLFAEITSSRLGKMLDAKQQTGRNSYPYGRDYVERVFDEKKIPDATTDMNVVQEEYRQVIKDVQKNADKIVNEKDKEIERLLALNKELRNEMKVQKARNIKNREYVYEPDLSEWTTRKRYIDADLEANGYVFDQDKKRNCVEVEYPVVGMPNQTGRGYVDYVIWGDTGKIIAVVEAKKASESGDKGRNQGKLYADCIQNMQGKRPIIFYTNGFETYLWDDANSAPRLVSGIFPQKDINAMIERRCIKKSVNSIQIDKQITDRWYQLRAVTKCCENYEKGIRKCLLVMATGTGKTRTAASIVDVMTRSELMGKVLFLADRKELVKQAKDAFYKYIENTTMCNLLLNKDERNAKIIFSTYQTMLHAIDTIKNADGSRFFSPGHFSLIVIDEAHRSIFNKYKAIFQYFDACLLGLTATPKNTIHQSTYTFFDMKNNIPTDVYEYEEAVEKDHVLVPFYLIETSTQISDDGITYADLDEEEREAYEAEFVEDGGVPEHIPPERINKYIFNVDTVDRMISDLMNNGIRHKNGNHVGKTIIFAQNKLHAKFIVDRFNELYPQYKGNFCKLVVCDEPYAGQNLKDFKKADDYPFITVTVDMLETGVSQTKGY